MNITEMSNKELKDEFITYDELINKVGCFGTKDAIIYDRLIQEIEKRGGTITEKVGGI